MRVLGLLLLSTGLLAAESAPVRGVLLERDSQPGTGQFSVRLPDNQVLRFRFDAKTTVDRDQQTLDVQRLKTGEKVEVISEPLPGLVLRYAVTVHAIADPPLPPPQRTTTINRLRTANRYTDERPAGNLTYTGVVASMGPDRIVIHTRDGREQAMLLRTDTRYLRNGDLVDAATLKLNTPVFVRAGKDLWDQIEAYQVIWGKILAP